MRSALLSRLGAVLGLGASGAFASVICDPKLEPGMNGTYALVPSTKALAEVTKHCIENICTTKGTDITSTEHCGQLVITITQLDAPHLDVGSCVGQLRSIVEQCIATEDAPGGTSQAHDVLYDVSVADGNGWSDVEELDARSEEDNSLDDDEDEEWSEDDWAEKRMFEYVKRDLESKADDGSERDEHLTLEARGRGGRGGSRKTKAGKTLGRNKPKNKPKTSPKTKSKTSPKTKPKTSPKTKPKTSPKSKPKTPPKSKQNKEPKACSLPKNKKGKTIGKPGRVPRPRKKAGSKAIRGIGEDHLSHVEHRKLLPRGNGQSTGRKPPTSWVRQKPNKTPGKGGGRGGGKKPVPQREPEPQGCNQAEYYKETILSQDEATWWSFSRKTGWNNQVGTETRVLKTLRGMTDHGKFDVIELKSGYMQVMGVPSGGTNPSDFERIERGDPYLVSNGGFFNMGNYNAVGKVEFKIDEQVIEQDSEEIPVLYRNNYEKIEGDDGSSLYSGPNLPPEGRILFRGTKWRYWQPTLTGQTQTTAARMQGSLAHASQPNERLGLVKMQNGDKYLFAYTARSRTDGMNIEQFRDLIMVWFRNSFITSSFDPGDIKQAINLDGGASIYVSWNDGSGGEPVRIAKGNDEEGITTTSGKTVANLIKITPGVELNG